MRRGHVLPIAVMAFAIVALLFMITWSITPDLKWPWSTTEVTSTTNQVSTDQVVCTREAKLCPDGSSVGRTPPNCDFAACPVANTNQATNTSVSVTSATATVIYSTTKSSTTTDNRYWPTIELFRTVDQGKAEVLTTVGKVGEYPADFRLSPNDRYLAISLEKKVALLDLQTKKLTMVMNAGYAVSGMVFSQDSTKLFIWDQAQDTSDHSYIAHSIDMATLTDRQVGQGVTQESFQATAWRADGIVIMMRYYYPIGTLFRYTPSTNTFEQVDDTSSTIRLISPSGQLYALASSISNPCNDYSGSAFSSYLVKNTGTGQLVGTFGDGLRENTLVAYSPNDEEVLWSAKTIPTSYADCPQETKQYYRQNIVSGDPELVDDPVAVLRDWGAQTLIMSYEQGADPSTGIIVPLFNGQNWHLPDNVSIVASFFTTHTTTSTGSLRVTLLNADTLAPADRAAVSVYVDNGVRCVQAPCPTNGRTWTGTTDANGVVTLPSGYVDESMTFSVSGFTSAELHTSGQQESTSAWILSLQPKT